MDSCFSLSGLSFFSTFHDMRTVVHLLATGSFFLFWVGGFFGMYIRRK